MPRDSLSVLLVPFKNYAAVVEAHPLPATSEACYVTERYFAITNLVALSAAPLNLTVFKVAEGFPYRVASKVIPFNAQLFPTTFTGMINQTRVLNNERLLIPRLVPNISKFILFNSAIRRSQMVSVLKRWHL